VQVVWCYHGVPVESLRRVAKERFELWGAPGRQPSRAAAFRDEVVRVGGKGLLMTMWIPCRKPNRRRMLEAIHAVGPIYRGDA